jgi:hypothetical protein
MAASRGNDSVGIEPAALRTLLDYWSGKRGDRAVPLRADIDPAEIPSLLPYVMLLEIERAPLRFRYRLAGSNTYDIRKGLEVRSVTGHYVDEMEFHIAPTAVILDFLRLAMERARPVYRQAQFPAGAARSGMHNALALPLAGETGEITMLLVGAIVTPPAGKTPPPPVRLEVL